jgi:hypothetical protein
VIEEPRSIFRAEALALRAGRPTAGETLERAAPWVEPVFWVLLVICAAALGLCMTATVPEYASGPARLDSERAIVIAAVPSRFQRALKPGQALTFTTTNDRPIGGMTVESITSDILDPVTAQRLLLPEVATDGDMRVVVIARARPVTREAPRNAPTTGRATVLRGRADVRIGSQPILFAFVPGLRRLVDRGDE